MALLDRSESEDELEVDSLIQMYEPLGCQQAGKRQKLENVALYLRTKLHQRKAIVALAVAGHLLRGSKYCGGQKS